MRNGYGKKKSKWPEYYDYHHHHQTVQICCYQFVTFLTVTPLVCSPFRFKPFLAVVPNTFLLYILSAYNLSDSYVCWFCCYKTSGYYLSESTVFICHPLKCSLVFPKDLSFRYTYLFITALCNSIKHPKYTLF